MGSRTISVHDEAYDRLARAKRGSESFSDVIMRARWEAAPLKAGDFLRMVRERGPVYGDAELGAVEDLRKADRPPRDKWPRR